MAEVINFNKYILERCKKDLVFFLERLRIKPQLYPHQKALLNKLQRDAERSEE